MDINHQNNFKIPTLLGLSLLITALILGVGLFYYQQHLLNSQKSQFTPKSIQVLNLNDSQATIVWDTNNSVTEQIVYGTSKLDQTQPDNRDLAQSSPHQVHFVTLRDLTPQTTYKFQITSGPFRFPDKPMSFTTPKVLDQSSGNRPLRGSVLNVNLNPIDEALVFLKIDGAADMATFTSTAGNFILPLKELRTQDLSDIFTIKPNTSAQLIIKKGDTQSTVDLDLPLNDNQLLPPLTLGQNINLKNLIAPPTPVQDLSTLPVASKFDLNNDGKINTLDLAIINQNKGKKVAQADENVQKADVNEDGTIDQKDANLLLANI